MGTPASGGKRAALCRQLIDGCSCVQRTLSAYRQISIDGRILRFNLLQNKVLPTPSRLALRGPPLFEPRKYRSASNSCFHYHAEQFGADNRTNQRLCGLEQPKVSGWSIQVPSWLRAAHSYLNSRVAALASHDGLSAGWQIVAFGAVARRAV